MTADELRTKGVQWHRQCRKKLDNYRLREDRQVVQTDPKKRENRELFDDSKCLFCQDDSKKDVRTFHSMGVYERQNKTYSFKIRRY